jgi:hypothetical protein
VDIFRLFGHEQVISFTLLAFYSPAEERSVGTHCTGDWMGPEPISVTRKRQKCFSVGKNRGPILGLSTLAALRLHCPAAGVWTALARSLAGRRTNRDRTGLTSHGRTACEVRRPVRPKAAEHPRTQALWKQRSAYLGHQHRQGLASTAQSLGLLCSTR